MLFPVRFLTRPSVCALVLIIACPPEQLWAKPAANEDVPAEAAERGTQPAGDTKGAKPTAITAKSLHSAMQKAAVKYRHDQNELVNDQRLAAMRQEFVRDFGNPTITYRVKIRRIAWKDGVATLQTNSPMPDVKASNQNPLRFQGPSELELKMEAKEAAGLQPDDWVTFTGTLTLQPGKWGAVGKSTHSQQQFTISHHKLLPGHFIGTYTSVDYTGEIKGKVYLGRWQAEDAGK